MKLFTSIALASVANAVPSPIAATETTQAVDTLMDTYEENSRMEDIEDFKFALDEIVEGLGLVADGYDVLSSLYSNIQADSIPGNGVNRSSII